MVRVTPPIPLRWSSTRGSAIRTLSRQRASIPARNLSLYVHIPFCHKLCYYCGCNKVITRHQHKADQYLDYLEQGDQGPGPLFKERLVTQLHWGGGTPTYLSEPQTVA